MRTLTLLMIAIILISTSCSKTEELDFVDNDNKEFNEPLAKHLGNTKWKMPLLIPDPDNEHGDVCVEGIYNCLYYCCITPRTISDFIFAIDNEDVRSFLSDAEILNELGQGVKYYEQLLKDVRDGNKFVMYYEYRDRETVMLLYGSEDLSFTEYEAAQALIR